LAEFDNLKREMFDEAASAAQPLLSVQTFRHGTDPPERDSPEDPQQQFLARDKNGPFGRLAPHGHVWIRIDADYAGNTRRSWPRPPTSNVRKPVIGSR
jgi:hypothetical protein